MMHNGLSMVMVVVLILQLMLQWTSFTINGSDVTAIYHAGRRIKLTASTPGTIFGTISSSSFSSNTTVNVTWDSGSLSNRCIKQCLHWCVIKNK